MLTLDSNSSAPLIAQIVDGIKKLIVERRLRGGMKIPSIRQFAVANRVSVSTVVEAYDRLVAEGFLVARQNTGFYVRSRSPEPTAAGSLQMPGVSFDSLWLVKNIWESRSVDLKPGCGWLPESWLDEEGVRRNLRNLSSKSGRHLVGYGHAKGFPSLRWKISDWLNEHQICAPPEQTLLTTGASHALALIAHYLVRPGDDVLVDEPGYGVLLFTLRSYGANLRGVPWTPEGPDTHALEALISERRPKAFFTNPRLQNPTGVTYSPAVAHRVLQLAERYDFLIVEDDIYAGLDPSPVRPLASMDQLSRVIYVSSFSKTISPSLRVGFVAAHPDFIEDLTSLKMMSGLTTSEISERLTHEILNEGQHRKHVKNLCERLTRAQETTCRRLEDAGMTLFAEPRGGMFVWARHPRYDDSNLLCNEAAEARMLLAPGHLFVTGRRPCPWMRFNVAFCDDPRLFGFLARTAPPRASSNTVRSRAS